VKLPTLEQNQLAAYRRWERRGKGDGLNLFDYYEARNDLITDLNYEDIAPYQLAGLPNKRYLGVAGAPCRFCGKNKPDVKFKNEAHALPEFLGNEALIDRNECDTCNNFFSTNLENNLSEFLLPVRTNLGMAGKTGVPTYASKASRIESDGTNMEIKQFVSDPVVIMDQARQKATMPLTVKTYVPIGVYKCLTKMALSIMPDAEAKHFDRTREWILTKDPTHHVGCFAGHIAYLFFVPGPKPIEHPWTKLLRRRDDSALLPHLILAVGSANLIFQSFVPLSDRDDFLHGHRFTFPRFGLPTGPGSEFGASTVGRMPLWSPDKVRGSTVTIEHHVESFHKLL